MWPELDDVVVGTFRTGEHLYALRERSLLARDHRFGRKNGPCAPDNQHPDVQRSKRKAHPRSPTDEG